MAAAAAVGVVEMKVGTAVVLGTAKTADVVSRVELKTGAAAAAAGIGAAKAVAVAVAGRVELKAAVACIETTRTGADAGILLNNLRPRPGSGYTGLEQSATDCVAQKVVVGVIGAFGFVAIRGAEVRLQLGNTVPQADMHDSDLDMRGSGPDPGHRCTVKCLWTGHIVGPLADPIVIVSTLVMILQRLITGIYLHSLFCPVP